MACDFCTNTFNVTSHFSLLSCAREAGFFFTRQPVKEHRFPSPMLLCLRSNFTVILYLRPDFPFGSIGSGKIEQGTSVLVYQVNSSAASAQAEAEYVESDGKRDCTS